MKFVKANQEERQKLLFLSAPDGHALPILLRSAFILRWVEIPARQLWRAAIRRSEVAVDAVVKALEQDKALPDESGPIEPPQQVKNPFA
jgi:hypothetical protein